MKSKIRVLSLFDGMSCGQIALERAGFDVEVYYASEIDKHAVTVAQANYPNTVQMGCVKKVREMAELGVLGRIDLLIGGSPCQGFSFAGKQLAFDDPRSALFFEYIWTLQALKRINPGIKFLLENVKMKREHLDFITICLGVKPHFINSALVSAQNRQRYYWYNWECDDPEDKGLLLKDIIEDGLVDREKSYCIDAHYYKGGSLKNYLKKKRRQIVGIAETENGLRPYKNDGRKGSLSEIGTIASPENKVSTITVANIPSITGVAQRRRAGNFEMRKDQKANALLAGGHQSRFITNPNFTQSEKPSGVSHSEYQYRKLTPLECERLQTVPDDYTNHVSDTQRYKMLGNGWTVDVIAHLLKGLKDELQNV